MPRESQYIDAYLAATANPETRYTPWTFLKYEVHGRAWDYSHRYYDTLMRAVSRRLRDGTVTETRSKGGSTAYIRVVPEGKP